jgi:hypothetical protein
VNKLVAGEYFTNNQKQCLRNLMDESTVESDGMDCTIVDNERLKFTTN